MAFMRCTREWVEGFRDVPMKEALETVRDDACFQCC